LQEGIRNSLERVSVEGELLEGFRYDCVRFDREWNVELFPGEGK